MGITLRDCELKDATIISEWKNDAYLRKMALDEDTIVTEETQLNDIKRAMESKYSLYKIIEFDLMPIGYVRIDYMDEKKEYAWLRFALGKERGKGYMKEALKLFVDTLYKQGCRRIEGEVYAYNIPSIKTLEQLGFIKEGVKREAHVYENEYTDIYVYGLLYKDWVELH